MSHDTGFEDYSLLDMFRFEVETHSETLSAALLALERAPNDTSRIEEMMRAAHSIKGASRVVGVDPAVTVAHVMEDCFVAAQSGAIAFTPADVDVLLRGVDLLGKIAAATHDPNGDLVRAFGHLVEQLAAELQGVLTGRRPAAAQPAPSPAIPSASSPAVRSTETVLSPAARSETIVFPELLDASAAEAIRRRLLAAIDSGRSPIRFDLRATTDLDVQGLVLLAAVPIHCATHNLPCPTVDGVSAQFESVLRVTGLAEPYGVRPTAPREAG
jgi:chemotaxis protein histidine kinase CheA